MGTGWSGLLMCSLLFGARGGLLALGIRQSGCLENSIGRPGKGRMKRRLLLLRALPCLNQLRSERRVLSLKLFRHDDREVG